MSLPATLYARAFLIDTSALISLYDPTDRHHQQATEVLGALADGAFPTVVTTPTLHESHRHLLYRRGFDDALRCVTETSARVQLVERTEAADDESALVLIRRYRDLALSMTDAVNMAVMLRLGVATAFAFDSDYYKVGFLVTPPFPPWGDSTRTT